MSGFRKWCRKTTASPRVLAIARTLLNVTRAGNYAHWLSADDIRAVLRLYYDFEEYRVVGDDTLFLEIVKIFKENQELTLQHRLQQEWNALDMYGAGKMRGQIVCLPPGQPSQSPFATVDNVTVAYGCCLISIA
ncbi:unnamed protein product [Trichogramma brassicae]|uniref:Uncharacterized protein n=1 Tax=Trichogramma brassicae TaxID=86971 RepID=A0A6H5I8Y9_9HYME|nr:unnamed protein product [Trichogramma brassicae]